MFIVLGQDGNGTLRNDHPMIEMLVHEVHGTTSDPGAVFERLLLCVQSGKCRQQRGMDVEHALWKGLEKHRREQAHVSRKADQIDAVLAQASDDSCIVLGARESL